MFDTVSNLGLGTAKASTTRYYLSTDTVRSANDMLLLGSRAVSSLEPGASLPGSATVTIPANVALGSYRVLVCADDTKVIAELDETNNCLAGNTVQVTLPNLEVTDISKPPSSVQRGHSFSVTDTVQNLGSVSAAATTTRYYLSLDLSRAPATLPCWAAARWASCRRRAPDGHGDRDGPRGHGSQDLSPARVHRR